MPRSTTILLIGGRDIRPELATRLPSPDYRLLYTTSLAEGFNESPEADLLVIATGLPGHEVLCQRLRSDELTTKIPTVLVVDPGRPSEKVKAEARVPASDLDALVEAVTKLLPPPALDAIPAAPAEEDEVDTARLEFAAGDWPPLPPQKKPGQDLLTYAAVCASYLDGLLKVLSSDEPQPPHVATRILQVAKSALADIEGQQQVIQSAITRALVGGDLTVAHSLTSAKNGLYEKHKAVHAAADSYAVGDLPRPASAAKLGGAVESVAPASSLVWPPRQTSTVPQLTPKKSELTLAAEAKAAAERVARFHQAKHVKAEEGQEKTAVRIPRSRKAIGATATTRERPLGALLVLGIVVGIVIAGLYFGLKKKPAPVASLARENKPPAMQWVVIEESPMGVMLRPQAVDLDEDRVSYGVKWFVNGNLVADAMTARLPADQFARGDRIYAEVTPNDGYSRGSPMRTKELTSIKPLPHALSPPPSPASPPAPGPTPSPVPPSR